jgi:hypothetical protein
MIAAATALTVFGVLAVMNNACKSGQHAWCAPKSIVRSSRTRI